MDFQSIITPRVALDVNGDLAIVSQDKHRPQLKTLRHAAIFWILSLSLGGIATAAHEHKEKYYQDQWCAQHNGRTEVRLPDKTRADCITTKNVIEFDFGSKWYEAVGQALYYSLQTGKRGGIVLILENMDDRKYWIRLNSTIEHFKLPIDTWEMGGS